MHAGAENTSLITHHSSLVEYAAMSEELSSEKNVLGGTLLACSYDPITGYFRDGCCATHGENGVAHLVCVKVTAEFLQFSRVCGHDLVTTSGEMRLSGL